MSAGRGKLSAMLVHFVLLLVVLASLLPFFVMVFGSLKHTSELASNPGGFPAHPTLRNYSDLFSYNGGAMIRAFFNAVFVSGAHTVLTLCVSVIAAFAFAKYSFIGRNTIFVLLMATMMVPLEITIPPQYIIFSKIHWLDTYWVQIVPGIANVFAMFMLVQFLQSISNTLIEAGRIDGAGHNAVFARIILPMLTPAISSLGILVFIGKWNDYLWPSIMLKSAHMFPILILLPTLSIGGNQFIIPWGLVLAGCVVVTLPIIILFLLFQEKFMSSMTVGAIKE
ncbi:carbohydrate ABC transporter permease [Cohnella sp. GCM10020058]|uniref:carbohydrate ABC transporter permease n=1 Tax=Cohnella sp. GCM10020058 TaxID=3317330 RepID=UPI00363E8379